MNVIQTSDWRPGGEALSQHLLTSLKSGRRTLWLIAGGSNIPIAVRVMQSLPAALTPALTITLTDERYGPIGHADSNWQQLMTAGFAPQQATQLPVLIENLSLQVTRSYYEEVLQSALDEAETVIGQFGMGPDGHIAGILPHSPAVTATGLVAAYETPTFKRLTTTFTAIRRTTAAYLFAFGEDKKPALERLQTGTIGLDDQPAQILRELPEVRIYNNQIGDRT